MNNIEYFNIPSYFNSRSWFKINKEQNTILIVKASIDWRYTIANTTYEDCIFKVDELKAIDKEEFDNAYDMAIHTLDSLYKGCNPNPVSSRICSLGTKCCNMEHGDE